MDLDSEDFRFVAVVIGSEASLIILIILIRGQNLC